MVWRGQVGKVRFAWKICPLLTDWVRMRGDLQLMKPSGIRINCLVIANMHLPLTWTKRDAMITKERRGCHEMANLRRWQGRNWWRPPPLRITSRTRENMVLSCRLHTPSNQMDLRICSSQLPCAIQMAHAMIANCEPQTDHGRGAIKPDTKVTPP
jgi:hypothetical protein